MMMILVPIVAEFGKVVGIGEHRRARFPPSWIWLDRCRKIDSILFRFCFDCVFGKIMMMD